MNTPRIMLLLMVIALLAACGHSTQSKSPAVSQEKTQSGQQKILYYRNAMNPSITSPVPRKDNMGMDYVPVYAEEGGGGGGGDRKSTRLNSSHH